MSLPADPDLQTRGRLIRSLGALREMLPGSFVERKRRCGRPNCHCADGQNLHSQFQISVLVDGKPKVFNVPAEFFFDDHVEFEYEETRARVEREYAATVDRVRTRLANKKPHA